jgi:hypothetical protein
MLLSVGQLYFSHENTSENIIKGDRFSMECVDENIGDITDISDVEDNENYLLGYN